MKALCVSMLLLISQGIASESSSHSHKSHYVLITEIPSDFREFLNTIGFSTEGKSVEEIKEGYATWIASQENQDRFLAEVSFQMLGDRQALCDEELDALESLRKAFRMWSKTLRLEEIRTKNPRRPPLKLHYMALSCSNPKCHCCQETHSIEEEVDAMRDEIADLKKEAKNALIAAGFETGVASVSVRSGNMYVAGGSIYYASQELIDACQKYNQAVDLENHIDKLERFAYEEGALDEYKSDKRWWQFWK